MEFTYKSDRLIYAFTFSSYINQQYYIPTCTCYHMLIAHAFKSMTRFYLKLHRNNLKVRDILSISKILLFVFFSLILYIFVNFSKAHLQYLQLVFLLARINMIFRFITRCWQYFTTLCLYSKVRHSDTFKLLNGSK